MIVMMKRYIFVTIAAMSLVGAALHAQDLDPTVVVNRSYEGSLMDVHKPLQDMHVPDSVTRFDLDFDYSVFDKPYKGSYEFNPYLLTMQPASAVQDPKQLYLRAGAGYTLHPTLDLVWALPFNRAFRMDAYASHRSYVGKYRVFKPELTLGETVVVDRWEQSGGDRTYRSGYDLESRAGVDGSYDWNKGVVSFDASYYGLASEDYLKTRHYDALDVKGGMASKPIETDRFLYGVDFGYRYGVDAMNYKGSETRLDEHVFAVDALLGHMIDKVTASHKVLFDVGLELVSYSHPEFATVAGEFHMVPHYVFSRGGLMVDAGVRLGKVMRSDSILGMYSAKDQFVYPDITATYDVISRYLRIYTEIGGGNKVNAYSSLLEDNHHFDMGYGCGMWPLMDFTIERVSAELGFKGRVSKFSYDLSGGYVNYANAPLDAITVAIPYENEGLEYLPGIGYLSYQKAFASALLNWKSESIKLDANLVYTYAFDMTDNNGMFTPSMFAGEAAVEYNWGRRIYAGVDCQFATERKGSVIDTSQEGQLYEAVIPGYADLGVYFEYAFGDMFSLWARGGNLLNMTIQRNPLYAENGVNFTVGICLNL